MINEKRLIDELLAVNLPVVGIAIESAIRSTCNPSTWHNVLEGYVRIDWLTEPSINQNTQAISIITNHNGALTESERLDNINLPVRYLWAIGQKLATGPDGWASLTIGQQNKVQAIINAGALIGKAKLG